jgi:1-acyl-sn-glycerol-3-phosphate acyltransferase
MNRLVSIGFWIFFALTCAVGIVVALTIRILSFPFDRDRRLNHLFSCAWGSLYAVAYPGWHVRVEHRERIVPGRPYVLVANHTSIADIILLFTLFRQFKWVSKDVLFRVPVIGWNMILSGYVPLKRGNKTSIEQMMAKCRDWLSRGVSVMMFPEGTRSDDGHLKPFKHGAFTLALDSKVPVIPIAIHGGHALIPKHSSTFAARADLVVEVLDPIAPDGFDDPNAYAESVRSAIGKALGLGFPEPVAVPVEARAP